MTQFLGPDGGGPSREPERDTAATLYLISGHMKRGFQELTQASAIEEFEASLARVREVVFGCIPRDICDTADQIEALAASHTSLDSLEQELPGFTESVREHPEMLDEVILKGSREILSLLHLTADPLMTSWTAFKATIVHLETWVRISGLEFGKSEAEKSFKDFLNRTVSLQGTEPESFSQQLELLRLYQDPATRPPEMDDLSQQIAKDQVASTRAADLVDGLHSRLLRFTEGKSVSELRANQVPKFLRDPGNEDFLEQYSRVQLEIRQLDRGESNTGGASNYPNSHFARWIAATRSIAREAAQGSDDAQVKLAASKIAVNIGTIGHKAAWTYLQVLGASARLGEVLHADTRDLLEMMTLSRTEEAKKFLCGMHPEFEDALEVERILLDLDLRPEAILTLRQHQHLLSDEDRIKLIKGGDMKFGKIAELHLDNLEQARIYVDNLREVLGLPTIHSRIEATESSPFRTVMLLFFSEQLGRALREEMPITKEYLTQLTGEELELVRFAAAEEVPEWINTNTGQGFLDPQNFPDKAAALAHLKSRPFWELVIELGLASEIERT